MEKETLTKFSEVLKAQVTQLRRSTIIEVSPENVKVACREVAALPNFYHLSTITGIDEGQEISLHYHFWQGREFATVRTKISKPKLTLTSIVDVLPAALLYEAEIADMLGVQFQGNPLMGRKLLLPDAYPPEAPPPLRREAVLPEELRGMMGLG